ncbi:MAG: glycosyltransferase family 39 protein [Burkholderiales bacterium]|nr:glycosyltransferase family 39 protein [Burkholderiales bacterium]
MPQVSVESGPSRFVALDKRLSELSSYVIVVSLVALVCGWVFLNSIGHTALHQDMAEQFVWAHSWQLGYPKHPPLPTWLFMAAQLLAPPTPGLLYTLAALCIAATGVFTYLFARELHGPRFGILVAVLWSLQQPFSWRAWIYNHNTVLIAAVAFTAWVTLRAAHRPTLLRWLWVGVGSALAMLTKLQAFVPLVGMVWALWRSGHLDQPRERKLMGITLLVAVLLSGPALYWMLTGHTNALSYGLHQLGDKKPGGESVGVLQFITSELRMGSLTLVALLAWIGINRRNTSGAELETPLVATDTRAWIQGLFWLPLAVVGAAALFGGARLHAQWGVQVFQFLALALVIWFKPRLDGLSVSKALLVGFVLQALQLAAALSPQGQKLHAPGAVQGYPAKVFAQRVLGDWQRYTHCPLHFVSAPFIEGGQLSAYLPGFPVVIEDGELGNSPWVDPVALAQEGEVVVVRDESAFPADVIHEPSMVLVPPASVKLVHTAYWGIRMPKTPCR